MQKVLRMSHIGFMQAVNGIAAGGWGKEYASVSDAEKDLVANPNKLAAFASVELLRRINMAVSVMGSSDDDDDDCVGELCEPEEPWRNEEAKVGSTIYENSYDGIRRHLVIAKHNDGKMVVVRMGEFSATRPDVEIPEDDNTWFVTVNEAIEAKALELEAHANHYASEAKKYKNAIGNEEMTKSLFSA